MKRGLIIAAVVMMSVASSLKAQDSVRAEPSHSPRGAVLRSMVIPGWGQVYNKQMYKVPFVYAAVGGATALLVINQRRYRDVKRAFRYAADPEAFAEFEPYYVGTIYEGISADRLFDVRNAYRRNRDLSIVAVLVVEALAVLDAYVAAHLFNFDVSEDLSVGPRFGSRGEGIGMRVWVRL